MADSNKIELLIKCLIGLAFVGFAYLYLIKPYFDERKLFFRAQYAGIISAIEKRPGHRVVPHVLLNHEWKLLNTHEIKVAPYIEVGDSIVKFRHSFSIFIYRWDANGNLIKKNSNDF